jgi:abortive infection bacteriophage resistance protein
VADYIKPWLSIDEQLDKLQSRGIDITDRQAGSKLLSAVGYYRVTGYLYPLRESEPYIENDGRQRNRIHNRYHPGTTLEYAETLISFDRELRMLVLDGIERIEISLRTQLGYILGKRSAFAHLDPANFVNAFTENLIDPLTDDPSPSKHKQWIERVEERRADSDEAFVAHFRDKYDDAMPLWALTEILEMGHLGRLYSGLNNSIATEIARAYGVPTKRMMSSWISSLNYVRNVSAHHARLFNRKLVTAPARPNHNQISVLGHLKDQDSAKETFGVYNLLAVMAYLIDSIDPNSEWPTRMAALIESFPTSAHLTAQSMGVPENWSILKLWARPSPE